MDHETDVLASLAIEDVREGSAAAIEGSLKIGDIISRLPPDPPLSKLLFPQ